jgi:RNA polymerase sigma-70 factor (ECF subfamily)
MDPEQEAEEVRRAKGGDRAAFERLVRATAKLVWASVCPAVRDPAWTEDLVQETYLRAWGSIRELTEPAAFRGWLLTIARRLAWRHAEVSGRPLPPPEGAVGDPSDPEDARERVQEALGRLPERYRLPVTLHLLNGQDYATISKELGLANGSLRGLIARGTKRLREALAPWWRTRHDRA